MDVNIERVEDVLLHKRLLEEAHEPMNGLVFDVRHSQVINLQYDTCLALEESKCIINLLTPGQNREITCTIVLILVMIANKLCIASNIL